MQSSNNHTQNLKTANLQIKSDQLTSDPVKVLELNDVKKIIKEKKLMKKKLELEKKEQEKIEMKEKQLNESVDASVSQHFINHTKQEIIFMINMYYDIQDYDNAVKQINDLIEVNLNILNVKERNLFMMVNRSKLLEIKKKLNALNEKVHYNNPNIISTHINEILLNNHIYRVENELREFCEKIVNKIEELQEKSSIEDHYANVFYSKLKADYMKYILEVTNDEEVRAKIEEECQNYYMKAYELCNNLEEHSPLVLSVILNYSVFVYNIIDDTPLALEMSECGYTNAIKRLDGRKIDEVCHILDMLESNIKIWKKELAVKK